MKPPVEVILEYVNTRVGRLDKDDCQGVINALAEAGYGIVEVTTGNVSVIDWGVLANFLDEQVTEIRMDITKTRNESTLSGLLAASLVLGLLAKGIRRAEKKADAT
jgi:hypothetical protein